MQRWDPQPHVKAQDLLRPITTENLIACKNVEDKDKSCSVEGIIESVGRKLRDHMDRGLLNLLGQVSFCPSLINYCILSFSLQGPLLSPCAEAIKQCATGRNTHPHLLLWYGR